ncbi:MAG: type I-C CRISPR-associated protein Cas5c [Synergistaceae bacterium]|jgi:CRISPR-associated protein Cas5d|nr:type I-C CRISPR-associated protein Cas5c [Synergistaceae bacterium]
MDNSIDFRVWGKFALFTDPLTKIGGEKCSYHVPTYEALKGIARSIYWKPTFIWVIDRVRVMKRIRTQTKGVKPLNYASGGNSLALYNYLSDVEYQVRAHFEWNEHLPELAGDRNDGKHYSIATRMLERGGRRDIFLGTRECQGYAEPCRFGEGAGELDGNGELAFGLMFHSFSYPEESGVEKLHSRFWMPRMVDGVVEFLRPEECKITKFVRPMLPNKFIHRVNFSGLDEEGLCE